MSEKDPHIQINIWFEKLPNNTRWICVEKCSANHETGMLEPDQRSSIMIDQDRTDVTNAISEKLEEAKQKAIDMLKDG